MIDFTELSSILEKLQEKGFVECLEKNKYISLI